MFGDNPIRKPLKGDGTTLEVQEVFSTLQGEGIYTGWPAVFLRLGGCNLACNFCDTEFESFAPMSLAAVLDEIEDQSLNDAGVRIRNLVVVTGGEPFRQPLVPLCEALIRRGFLVQIETNGTLFQKLPDSVDIICSPKVSQGRYHAIRADLLPRISAFKFIVSAQDKFYNSVPSVGQEVHRTPVYVQPMDEKDGVLNRKNQQHAVALAQQYGYRLSLQTHKIVGIA